MKCVILCVILTITSAMASRILFASTFPSRSHHIYYKKIINELIQRGHELTVVYPSSVKDEETLNVSKVIIETDEQAQLKYMNKRADSILDQLSDVYDHMVAMFKDGFHGQEMKKLLQKDKYHFDLIILETTVRLNILLTYFFEAPTLMISSLGPAQWVNERVGASSHLNLYPTFNYDRICNLTYTEKYKNIYNFILIDVLSNKYNRAVSEVIHNVTYDEVNYEDLINNIDVYSANIHNVWDFNRPAPPGLVYVGGIANTIPKRLPQDLQTFLDASIGFIYLSFGTNINSKMLPKDKVQIFQDVFSKLPYHVLWKWDEPLNVTKNIKIVDWVPQSDVLLHPKLKLFISHGGIHSTNEAISSEAPLLVVPTKFDQWYNGEKSVYYGIAKKLEIETLDEKELEETITDVIENQRYKKNIRKLKSVLMDMPQTPMEKVIWLVEYVLRHKTTKHLRSPGANLPWDQFFEVELLGIVLIVMFTAVLIVLVTLRYLLDILSTNIQIRFI